MDPQNNIQAVEKLMFDPVFSKSVKSAESLSEIVFLFAQKGIDVGEEELSKYLTDYAEDEELSESALESVIGGYITVSAAVLLCVGQIMNRQDLILAPRGMKRK